MQNELIYKERGRGVRPICPKCAKYLKVSYNNFEGTSLKVKYGWHCIGCKLQIWD